MAPLRGQTTCYIHSPRTASNRSASRRKAGQRRRVPNASAPALVGGIVDLQVHLGQALADAEMHENSLKRSMVVARLILAAAKLIEDGDITRRIDMIEQRLDAQETVR